MIDDVMAARTPRFVKTAGNMRTVDNAALSRARRVAGLKDYVTNIPAPEIITSYHELWHVEQSFRMARSRNSHGLLPRCRHSRHPLGESDPPPNPGCFTSPRPPEEPGEHPRPLVRTIPSAAVAKEMAMTTCRIT